ncbi:MAG: hypothetical protein IJ868_03170, partial [Prevotella sp.]|nr:hypothetical protein [Prevotella sp.]
ISARLSAKNLKVFFIVFVFNLVYKNRIVSKFPTGLLPSGLSIRHQSVEVYLPGASFLPSAPDTAETEVACNTFCFTIIFPFVFNILIM